VGPVDVIAEPELAVFDRKMPWDERRRLIQRQFRPEGPLDWGAAFKEDLHLMARILRDILKLGAAEPGRPGPRPAIDYETGIKRLRQLMGTDYALVSFAEAFGSLAGGRSLSHLARRTDISRSQVHRLLRGEAQPTAEEMAKVAKAFDKHPSYFVEFRAAAVAGALHERLMTAPESTIGFYRTITQEHTP
jgi:transcriptional regulator with XRE-family HTH domain